MSILHVPFRFLATEGGADARCVFHKITRIDDSRPAEIFAREVLAMLVRKRQWSPEWAERILSWLHSASAAAIDIAVRPGVHFHHGPGGKFNAGRGDSARSEQANSYPDISEIVVMPTAQASPTLVHRK